MPRSGTGRSSSFVIAPRLSRPSQCPCSKQNVGSTWETRRSPFASCGKPSESIRRVRPSTALPTRRLTGLALLAIAVLPAERLLGYSTGLIGDWLAGFLLDIFGRPLTAFVTLVVVAVGATLAMAVRFPRLPRHPHAAS